MKVSARLLRHVPFLVVLGCGGDDVALDGADDFDEPEPDLGGTGTTGAIATTDATTKAETGGTDAGATGETDGETGGVEASIGLEPVVDGLVAPTALVVAPDGTMVVLDQTGDAYRIEDGTLAPFASFGDMIVDLDEEYDERGLLGMTFHPDYPDDRRVYVFYSAPLRQGAPEGYDHTNIVAEFQVGTNGMLDLDSERQLGVMDWPAPNHNGGVLAFGPDARLYMTFGDGGEANDVGLGHPPLGNGQDFTTLLGSILRVDPEPGEVGAYSIPGDNPFAGPEVGADEIWAFGLRNPAAFSFDQLTGELYLADAGQNLMEEVNLVEAGANLGWNVREGTLCFSPETPDTPPSDCPETGQYGEPLVDPILTYTHPNTVVADMSEVNGLVVIGGYVYRGSTLPELEGMYVFGDWSSVSDSPEGKILTGRRSGNEWTLVPLVIDDTAGDHIGRFVRAFGQDLDGEIYVLTNEQPGPTGDTGAVWRLAPAGS